MAASRFLFTNGVIFHSPDTPLVSTFLESHPGAYTTTRTHNNGTGLLFWERHLQRLANSARLLLNSNPHLFLSKSSKPICSSELLQPVTALPMWDSAIKTLVNDSVSEVLPLALRERSGGEELVVTVLVSGKLDKLSGVEHVDQESVLEILEVHVHLGPYVPPVFGDRGNGAHLAVVGRGRDVAETKYSDWVRLRKALEKLRPPSATELLLSNDGDHVLEGCVTNFFVVCQRASDDIKEDDNKNTCPFELQTAPIHDGVLPGIIRQLVIEVCLSEGIPFREIAPSWSKRELWQEAFITNGLRIVQHVEKIQVPSSWESLGTKALNEISWEEKQFREDPGRITAIIQKGIMEKAGLEGYSW